METIVCDWSSIHRHGSLWYDHLKLRKAAFVDQQGWDVPHTAEAEWDQYDTPLTQYVITHDAGRVLSASRVFPCSYSGPNFSYMIRDATLGRLPNIPEHIIPVACTSTKSFEATRFTVDLTLARRLRTDALKENAIRLMEHCAGQGAVHVFALMPPGFVAWLRRAGLNARAAGPVVTNSQGEAFCVIECRRPFFKGADLALSA
jgi:N-acyl-L-homoserine lactone synthetase